MDKKPRRYRLETDPTLSPNDVVVRLDWTIDHHLEVTDVVMSPAWDRDRVWPVASFCEAKQIQFVQGEYSLTCDADGMVETRKLPHTISDGERRRLITAFAVALREDARHISSMLGHLPTDPQIIEATQMVMAEVLHSLLRRNKPGEPIIFPDVIPGHGLLDVIGSTPKDMIAEIVPIAPEDLEGILPDELKGASAHNRGIGVKLHDARRFGDYAFYAIKHDERSRSQDEPRMPQVCVGFVDSEDSSFSKALNDKLAARFDKAIELVEFDVATDCVASTDTFASMLLDLSGKLAEFYGIERVTVTAR